jgi:hypothetical protein
LSATAVTTAAFAACPAIVHDTVVVELKPTSGCTVALQLPRVDWPAAVRIVNTTVEGPLAPVVPPRFFTRAETTHGDPQAYVSTDSTM